MKTTILENLNDLANLKLIEILGNNYYKRGMVMSYSAEGLKDVAMLNKKNLRNKFFNITVKDVDYKFKVSGVGKRSIKIEKFFYYSDIIKAVADGNKRGFENEIKELIEGSDSIETANGLREKALANKVKLKNEFLDILIGGKFYEFRIAGIGFKSIKIEMYMAYDEIIKGLSSDNYKRLEFIFMELIIGDEFILSEFVDEFDSSSNGASEDDGELFEEVDIDDIVKLSEEEFDEKIVNVKGWNKLVFDSIDDILEEQFTLVELLNQNRILSYQAHGEDLKVKVLENLDNLIDLGLIAQISKTTYYKLW